MHKHTPPPPDDDALEQRYQQILADGRSLPVAEQARLVAALAANLAASVSSPPPPPPPSPTPAPPVLLTSPLFDLIQRETNPLALIAPNGFDPTIGRARYRFDLAGAREAAATNHWDKQHAERKLHEHREGQGKPKLGLVHGFKYDELMVGNGKHGAGWGLVVCAQDSAALLLALWPLLELRCEQQGFALPLKPRKDETCGAWLRRVVGDDKLNAPFKAAVPVFLFDASQGAMGETYNQWLVRHGLGSDAGPVDPTRGIPFYLLLAGRPGPRAAGDAHIPFALQYNLDIFWGVGRLCFTDAAGEHRYAAYTAYAQAAVRAETGKMAQRARELVYFGPRHKLDIATELSTTELIAPLFAGVDGHAPFAARFAFATRAYLEDAAQRTTLDRLLRGQEGQPAVLFSAGHGIDLPRHHPDLLAQQGALLCSDWSGYGLARREHWFTGDDLAEDAQVEGMIAVVFACFGVGCPQYDSFRTHRDEPPTSLAPYAFVAQLPQRLLERGALAVIGHVDRAWSYAFRDEVLNVPRQTQAFEDLLSRILDGKRLGEATDPFNLRQGLTAVHLVELLDKYPQAKNNPDYELERIGPRWIAFNDARAYALLGDPAVRIVADKKGDAGDGFP